MPTKTIRIKKRGGGTRLQKVEVLKSGKFKFVKNSKKSRSTKSSGKKKKTSRVKRVIRKTTRSVSMPRRTRRSSRRTSRKAGIVSPKIKSSLKQVMVGLGAASTIGLIGSVIGQPALGQNKLVSAGASFLIGGPIAAATTFLLGGGMQNQGGQQSGGMI